MGGVITKEKAADIEPKEEGKMTHIQVKQEEVPQLKMGEKDSDDCRILNLKEEPEDVEVPFSAADDVEVKMENNNELPGTSKEMLPHDVTLKTDLNLQDAGDSKDPKRRKSELLDDEYDHYRNRKNVKVIRRGDNQFLVCCLCGKEFKTMPAISKHLFRHPMPQPTLTCQVCDKQFLSPLQLQSHFSSHKFTYTCSECNKKFSSKKLLLKHRDDHFEKHESTQQVSDDETMLEPEPPEPVSDAETVLLAPEQVSEEETMLELKESDRDESIEPPGYFECRRCDCKFEKKSAWTGHVMSHALNDRMELCLYPIEEVEAEESGSEDAVEARRRNRKRQGKRFHEDVEIKEELDSDEAAETHRRPRKRQEKRFHEERTKEELASDEGCKAEADPRNRKRQEKRSRSEGSERSEQRLSKEDSRFKCKRCHRRFSEKSVWISHMKSHEKSTAGESEEGATGEEVTVLHDCLSCERKISENMWRIHLKSHALVDKVSVCLSTVMVN